jgi:mannose-6-phosphate isomerase-like protein (cupin superfamily)
VSDYTFCRLEEAPDWLPDYPGEMRSFTESLNAEQLAFTFRRMPPKTGGKGSYGHRHKTQEEIFFVISGTLQFKVADEIFDVGPKGAVRVAPHAWRSMWNEGPEEVQLVIVSPRVPPERREEEDETIPDFWPE